MSALSDRIKSLVEGSGMSLRGIAKKLNVSNVTVHNWVQGKSEPSKEGLEALCELFEVTPAYVLFGDGNAPHGQTIINEDVVSIPYINAKPSAGGGCDLNGDELVMIRFIRVSIEMIHRYCPTANVRSLQIMTCLGDSMIPTLNEGDTVVVDVSEKTIKRDGLYVVRIGNSLFVKRVQITPKGLRLLSDNSLYSPIDAVEDEISVIGRAHIGLCIKRL